MGKKHIKRILGVWLMTAVFAMPFVVRSMHTFVAEYGSSHCISHCSHHHGEDNHHGNSHDCNTCPVCKYVISSFDRTETVSLAIHSSTSCSILPVANAEKGFTPFYATISLRAPPPLHNHS